MDNEKKQGLSLSAKASITANSLLFGITGIIYLLQESKSNVIGMILLVAGFLNILYILTKVRTRNILFVILNFIFSFAALVVTIDFLLAKNNFAILWVAITLIYLIVGFVLLLKINKAKAKKIESPE
jgi:predicted membrane protein